MKTYPLTILALVITLVTFAQALDLPLSVSLNKDLVTIPIVESVMMMLKERDLLDHKAED